MKNILLVYCVLLFDVCTAFGTKKTLNIVFKPNAPEIDYQGRVDFSDSTKAVFCYSGVTISTIFYGTGISMVMEDFGLGDEKHVNYFAIIIDGQEQAKLAMKQGKHTYILAQNLSLDKHRLQVFKRTECFVGTSVFYGFEAPKGTKLFTNEKLNRTIEFIGDSYTCGYGNEASILAPPVGQPKVGFHSVNENNYASYSAITARMLNANYRVVAYSGRGVYRNNTGSTEETLPKIYKRILPDDIHGQEYDLQNNQPSILVVALGGNDFFSESNGDFLNDSSFVKTYIDFVKKLRSYYPQAKIVCAVNNSTSDYWPEGRKCGTRLKNSIQSVVDKCNQDGYQDVYYFKWEAQKAPYGEDWHQALHTHQKMADILAPFLNRLMGWE